MMSEQAEIINKIDVTMPDCLILICLSGIIIKKSCETGRGIHPYLKTIFPVSLSGHKKEEASRL